MLFKNNTELKKKDFENEKELQKYFEENLKKILGLKFIATEFKIENYRIDTVAFDDELKSFKIIEYKNIKSISLVDQGLTYLKILNKRKADFVLKYNEVTKKSLGLKDISWDQSRVIFVSPEFTNFQLGATAFQDLPLELYKVTKYDDNLILINSVKETSNVKFADINKEQSVKVLKEIKVYTEEDHLNNKPEEIIDMYNVIKEEVLKLGNIEVDPKKVYIAFKGTKNIIDIEVQQGKIKIHINLAKGKLYDPKKLAINQEGGNHLGNGDYRLNLNNLDDLDYILYLIKQSYEVNK